MINDKSISISLFTGAFGLDLGLEQAGFQTVSVVEADRDAAKTIALNRPLLQESAVPRDIRTVSAQTLLAEGGRVLNLGRPLHPGEVDLVTGEPPCQPFSTAGKRGSVGDPRGSLFIDFMRIVDVVQPRFFVMENVRGLLSAPIRHRFHAHRGMGCLPLEPDEMPGAALNVDVVLSEMKRIGYTVVYGLVNTADYGVPQVRERLIFIGSRDEQLVTLPLPTHSKTCADGKPLWRSLKEGLEGLVDSQPEYIPYSENEVKYLRLLKAGQNWRHLPNELTQEGVGALYRRRILVSSYRRLSWDEPSPTLSLSFKHLCHLCHPDELRPLSVRESARIQTFPDDWIFCGSTASMYRKIGNASPVLLGKVIGEYIHKLILYRGILSASVTSMRDSHKEHKQASKGASLMNLDQLKEEVSCAYVSFVASVAGYSFQRADRISDNDGIDATIIAPGKIGPKRRPRIDVQIKCTSLDICDDQRVSYPLKIKNYEELRDENVDAPQILVVVLVPDNPDNWFIESEQEQRINFSSYWISLRGRPPTQNTTTKTIYIPRENLFTVNSLRNIMQRAATGETL